MTPAGFEPASHRKLGFSLLEVTIELLLQASLLRWSNPWLYTQRRIRILLHCILVSYRVPLDYRRIEQTQEIIEHGDMRPVLQCPPAGAGRAVRRGARGDMTMTRARARPLQGTENPEHESDRMLRLHIVETPSYVNTPPSLVATLPLPLPLYFLFSILSVVCFEKTE